MSNVETLTNPGETSEEAKRTRYSGPVVLEELAEEVVDSTTSGMGRGRPAIDLKPYEEMLAGNFAKNSNRPADSKLAIVLGVNTEAVSTVKSRFNTAAANINVGVQYRAVDNGDGTTKLSIVVGKRAEGRGRKPRQSPQTEVKKGTTTKK